MTAKRFKVVNLRDDSICDIQDTSQEILTFYNDLTYNFGSAKAICDLLNELAEENEELKKRVSHAEKVNIGLIEENHRLRLTLIHSSDLNFDINWLKENLKDWNNYD